MSLDSEVTRCVADKGGRVRPCNLMWRYGFLTPGSCLCAGKGPSGSGCGPGACQGGSAGGRQTTTVSTVLGYNRIFFK